MNYLQSLEDLISHYRMGVQISLKNNDLKSAYNFIKIIVDCLPKGYKSKLRGNLSKKSLKDLIRRNERNIARLHKRQNYTEVEQ